MIIMKMVMYQKVKFKKHNNKNKLKELFNVPEIKENIKENIKRNIIKKPW